MKKEKATINDFDFTKSEATVQNITIPRSVFSAKWVKDEGYAIGYENIKLTKNYETLEEALNQIGYGVDNKDELVKVGEVDYELIARIAIAVLTLNNLNNEKDN